MNFCQHVKDGPTPETIQVCVMSEGHANAHWYAEAPRHIITNPRPNFTIHDAVFGFAMLALGVMLTWFLINGGYFS